MSREKVLEKITSKAVEKERKYAWLDARGYYEEALGQTLSLKDFLKAGEIQERIGYCMHAKPCNH